MEKTNKIHVWLYTILIAALIGVAIWALNMNRSVKAYEITTENNYNRAFYEMTGYIGEIDALLSKAQLANDPAILASMSSEIFRKAAGAKSCLGQLPTSQVNLENTSKFLSQVGDYTYVLSQDMINGQEISQEEYETLANLNTYAANLKTALEEIQTQLYSGELKLSDANAQEKLNEVHAASGDILTDLENVEESFREYPTLIYDGPFSEHIENQQSQMLANEAEITGEEARKRAEEFLGTSGLELSGEAENTAIDCYIFSKDEQSGHISISITKKGGYVLYFLKNRTVEREEYDLSSATEIALSYLERHGFENMVSSYFEKKNGIATINFAASQDGTVCYSDLVKVRVALDSGEVVGLETKGYLMNHRHRSLENPVLSEEEARARVSTSLDVTATKLAVIPKDSLREVLCYEFKGTFHDKNFIVYVNAENGHEEQILLLIEGPEGILTI